MDFSVTSANRKSMSDTIEIDGDLDIDLNIPNGGSILIVSNDQSYLTHGIHKFPAKFFPELPRYLIRKYSEIGDIVLDPMCGSGTTLLETILNERIGIGIDIDPIARLISKVKITPIESEPLKTASDALIQKIQDVSSSDTYQHKIPNFNYRDNWFRPFVLKELAIIKTSISMVVQQRPNWIDIEDFFRVVFSSIIRDVSNADPHCTRTVIRKKVVKKINPGDTLTRFVQTLLRQREIMDQFNRLVKKLDAIQGSILDGTAIKTGLEDNSIDLAVTSPPYINAVDYPRTHQLEMYWLGLIDGSPLSHMKRKYIGTETVYKKEYEQLQTSGLASLDPLLKMIHNKDPRRSFIVFKFFRDMEKQLREMYRVLKPGSRYCISIGSNQIRGVEVRSDLILSEMAVSKLGFELEKSFFSKLIRHFIRIPRPERMLGEWILVLKK